MMVFLLHLFQRFFYSFSGYRFLPVPLVSPGWKLTWYFSNTFFILSTSSFCSDDTLWLFRLLSSACFLQQALLNNLTGSPSSSFPPFQVTISSFSWRSSFRFPSVLLLIMFPSVLLSWKKRLMNDIEYFLHLENLLYCSGWFSLFFSLHPKYNSFT